jgi:hypothetical protein
VIGALLSDQALSLAQVIRGLDAGPAWIRTLAADSLTAIIRCDDDFTDAAAARDLPVLVSGPCARGFGP